MSSFVKKIQFIIGKVLSLDRHAYRELRDGLKLLSFPFSVPASLSSSSLMGRSGVSPVYFCLLSSLFSQCLTSLSWLLVCHYVLAIERGDEQSRLVQLLQDYVLT